MSSLIGNLLGIGQSQALQAAAQVSQSANAPVINNALPTSVENRPSTVVSISRAAYDALAQEQQSQPQLVAGNASAAQQTSAVSSPMVELKQLPAYLFQVGNSQS